MKIKVATTNQEFLDLYQNILDENEVLTQLFTINCIDKEKILDINSYRGAVYDNNQLKLIFLNANPFNLLLFGIDNNEEICRVLVEDILKNNIQVLGVSGTRKDIDLISVVLKDKALFLQERLAMDIMVLTKLENINEKGMLLLATEKDSSFLYEMYKEFYHEAVNEDISDDKAQNSIDKSIIEKNLFIYYNEENIPTSIVKAARILNKGQAISLVYTSKKYRGFGYATSMVYLISKMILSDGFEYVTLFVDKHNPISNHIYEKVGYEYISEYYDMKLIKC